MTLATRGLGLPAGGPLVTGGLGLVELIEPPDPPDPPTVPPAGGTIVSSLPLRMRTTGRRHHAAAVLRLDAAQELAAGRTVRRVAGRPARRTAIWVGKPEPGVRSARSGVPVVCREPVVAAAGGVRSHTGLRVQLSSARMSASGRVRIGVEKHNAQVITWLSTR